MPLVNISLFNIWNTAEQKHINQIVHDSLVEAFQIPETDFNHRLTVYTKDSWILPPGRTQKSLLIEITIFPGRSAEAKKKLYNLLHSRLTKKFELDDSDIMTVLHETQLINWGLKGGISGEDTQFHFKLNV